MRERSGLDPFGGNLSLAERLWQEPTDFPQSSMGQYLAIMLFIHGPLGNGQVRRKSFEVGLGTGNIGIYSALLF